MASAGCVPGRPRRRGCRRGVVLGSARLRVVVGCRRADPGWPSVRRTSVRVARAPGPSTVNHLRYNVFHVPSRRMRSSVPLTNRTRPVFSRLMPMPYGSSSMLGPTMCRYGSWATRPARIESSVLTASTCRCCSATRQSAHVTTSTMTGGGVICWMRCSDVVPFTAHTRLPDRSDACVIVESRGARIRWLADRYSVEKFTSFLALAGDAHGLDHDVDLVVLQRGDAVGRRQDAVLDL